MIRGNSKLLSYYSSADLALFWDLQGGHLDDYYSLEIPSGFSAD